MPRGNGTATVSRWNSRPRSRTKRTARSRYRRRVGIPRFSTAGTPRESLGKGFRIKNRKKIIVFFGDIKIIATFALAIEKIDASLAQLVEHDTLNVGVQGSSPWGGTKKKRESTIPVFFCYRPRGLMRRARAAGPRPQRHLRQPSGKATGSRSRKRSPDTRSPKNDPEDRNCRIRIRLREKDGTARHPPYAPHRHRSRQMPAAQSPPGAEKRASDRSIAPRSLQFSALRRRSLRGK